MNTVLLLIIIIMLSANIIMQTSAKKKQHNDNVKTLSYPNSAREIVKDLVANWNSPLVYLKNRGYLRAPEIGFDKLLADKQSSEVKASKDNKNVERVARSNVEGGANDLTHLFRTFFSTNDNVVSDKIKSKLGLHWDVNALKNSVRNEAFKYYEKFYDKPNQQASDEETEEVKTDIEKQVAQLYPSVVISSDKENAAEEEKVKESSKLAEHKEPNYLNGIAKLLTNRVKPPLQLNEEQNANPTI